MNIDPAEGDLATIEPGALKTMAPGAALRWISVVGKEGKLQPIHDEVELWWIFLVATLAVLAAETYLARRFSGSGRSNAVASGQLPVAR